MNETVLLFERWKLKMGVASDSDGAKRLGIKRAAVSHWRRRGSHADASSIVQMCADCGEDLAECLKRIAAERKRDQAPRAA